MPVESWDDPHGSVQVEDHYDLVKILSNAEAEGMLTVGDLPVISNLYRRFRRALVRSAIFCQKVAKGKHGLPRNPVICNYGTPMPSLDLFGVAGCS